MHTKPLKETSVPLIITEVYSISVFRHYGVLQDKTNLIIIAVYAYDRPLHSYFEVP